ncbi:MAG: Xaa-Pro peptidase family protein [Candidatus Bathyarchaeia archaeon]
MNDRSIFEERCLRAKKMMGSKGVDALCLTPSPDMYYLTGFWTSPSERMTLCIIPRLGEPLIVTSRLYEGQVKATSWIENVEVWSERLRQQVQLKNILKKLRLLTGKLAVPERIWMSHYKVLCESAPRATFTSTSKILSPMRILKSDLEVKLMEEAAKLADDALEKVMCEVKEGVREFELAAKVEYFMRVGGSEGAPFETIVASGPNSALPHHGCSSRTICEGDPVTLDIGATYGRYCSDITRTLIVGRVEPRLEEVYRTVYKAHQEALEAIKPGVEVEAIDLAARRVIGDCGYGEYFIHRTGHGVGLDIHEPPYIQVGSHVRLRPGMVFTVEPGVYIPGVFGVRIEDVVVVSKDGYRLLTKHPRDLTCV